MAYPIATLIDGRIRWSDGTITAPMSTQPLMSTQPQNTTQQVTTASNTTPSTQQSADQGGSSSNPYTESFNQFLPKIDKYVNDLIDFANEDYDFVAKWIETQYKKALGENDQERANFLKSVANELESQIGTIAYDYQTKTYRTERDKKVALDRLQEDEKVARQEIDTEAGMEREAQVASLNERGLVYGKRDEMGGLGGKNVRNLEDNILRRYQALDRAVGRNKYGIETGAADTLEDLTTAARRAAAEGQYAYDYGLASADFKKKRAILEAQQLGDEKKDWLAQMSSWS